ncbi:hypothetical protein BLNAU_17169 [Blattamonas nauphoetae]|uniref:Uncharacterized protein n=1 Tax=Blattamonas nauphoetae TaxID=2049346 RepID=A0ABQ9X9M2_9EUKA|nr:hypothetical protein BLNAU_17169 [Blattamonas nauphoetae]
MSVIPTNASQLEYAIASGEGAVVPEAVGVLADGWAGGAGVCDARGVHVAVLCSPAFEGEEIAISEDWVGREGQRKGESPQRSEFRTTHLNVEAETPSLPTFAVTLGKLDPEFESET